MAIDTVNTARLDVNLTWDVKKTVTGLNGPKSSETIRRLISFAVGAGADQINEVYSAVLSVNASTTTDFDLSAALTNVVNDVNITLARVKLILVELLTATDTDPAGTVIGTACSGVTILGDAASPLFLNTAATTINLGNGDCFLLVRRSATGVVITGGSADVLQIQNTDGAVAAKVRVTIFGAAT